MDFFHRQFPASLRAAVHHGIGLSSGSVEGQYAGLFQTPLHPCVHSLRRLGASLCLFTLVVGRSRLGQRENPLAHVPLQFPVQRHTSLVCVHVDRVYFFMPILSPWLKQVGRKEELFFLGLWFLTTFWHYVKLCVPGGEIYGECSWNDFHILYYNAGYIGFSVDGTLRPYLY